MLRRLRGEREDHNREMEQKRNEKERGAEVKTREENSHLQLLMAAAPYGSRSQANRRHAVREKRTIKRDMKHRRRRKYDKCKEKRAHKTKEVSSDLLVVFASPTEIVTRTACQQM